MYIVGNTALYAGLLMAAYGLAANFIGIKKNSARWLESARGAVLALVLLTSVASFLLFYLLGTGQF
ncbi:MAG: heme lyase CcmF/NrfE family subunit, partial [Bacillales bacterium]